MRLPSAAGFRTSMPRGRPAACQSGRSPSASPAVEGERGTPSVAASRTGAACRGRRLRWCRSLPTPGGQGAALASHDVQDVVGDAGSARLSWKPASWNWGNHCR